MEVLFNHFKAGGIWMWPILFFGIAAISIVLERVYTLFIKVKAAPSDFRERLLTYLQKADYRGAETYCWGINPQTPLTKIVGVGCHLRATAAGEEELQARMDEGLSSEISYLDKRAGFLGMLGNVATLLGLLGTVSGMITSFAAVASANPADRALLLSSGISEALNATAFGLIVAIPSLVAFSLIQNRTDTYVAALTEDTARLFHDLLFLTEPPRSSRKADANLGAMGLTPQPTGA